MYGRGYNYAEQRCKHCQERHRHNQQCCIACPYCHEYHPKSQMTNFICPQLRNHVKPFHQKDGFSCRACEGEGTLEKGITTTFLETEDRYLKRLEKYNSELMGEQGSMEPCSERPMRKVIKTSFQKEIYRCEECHGSGIIQKVINCCLEGCNKCQYERCYINPTWSNYYCDPIAKICMRRETCISCETPIKIRSKYFMLGCGHNYHDICYVREVYLAGGACAECGYHPQQEANQQINLSFKLNDIQKPEKIQSLNTDYYQQKKALKSQNEQEYRDIVGMLGLLEENSAEGRQLSNSQGQSYLQQSSLSSQVEVARLQLEQMRQNSAHFADESPQEASSEAEGFSFREAGQLSV